MRNLKTAQQRWRNLIKENRLTTLFDDLSTRLNPSSQAFRGLIYQNSRFQNVVEREMNSLMTYDEANIERNKIIKALQSLIDQLTIDDLGDGGNLRDELDELLQQLKVKHPLTPLYLVNCDRTKNNHRFRQTFRAWEADQRRSQIYFALGCPTQEPEGFGERIVFELLDIKSEGHADSIAYPRVPGSDRLAIPELPSGFTLKDAQDNFKKYLAERFRWGNNDFEDFLNHQLPARQESYIALPFSIVTNDWDPDIMEDYLRWIWDSFATTSDQGPVCLFIFIFWIKGAHQPETIRLEREEFDSAREFLEGHADQVRFLYPFPEVPRLYLEQWLQKVADVTQHEIDQIMELFCHRLNDDERQRYESEDQLLDMERVEELQERIWTLHR